MKNVRAGALAYVIVLSLVIISLLGFLIMREFYLSTDINLALERDAIRDNINSVVDIASCDESLLEYGKSEKLFSEGNVDLSVEKEDWGLLSLIKISTRARVYSDTLVMLCADEKASCDSTAFWLTDANNYVSVAGNTFLKGNCFIPRLGVRKGYIESRGYYRDTLIYGNARRSTGNLPVLNDEFSRRFSVAINCDDSEQFLSDSLVNSFYEDEFVIHSDCTIDLSGKYLKGKVRIVSEESVLIDSTTYIDNCIVCAPNISVGSGFKGRVQLFASHCVLVEPRVKLRYPSYIYVKSDIKSEIDIAPETMVYGGVIMQAGNKSVLRAFPKSVVKGQLYCNARTQLSGVVEGCVYVNKLIYYNRWAKYEDVLFETEIDRTRLWNDLPVLSLFENSKKKNTGGMVRLIIYKLRGSTLPEALIAMAILLVIMGISFSVLVSSSGYTNPVLKFNAIVEINSRLNNMDSMEERVDTIAVGK